MRWLLRSRAHSDLISHLCRVRGLPLSSLEPDFSKHLHPATLLPGMAEACRLISWARQTDAPVMVFGDYDADGTPAAALLYLVFRRLGLKVEVMLPKRDEGYGLNPNHIRTIANRAKLLVTVDVGITAAAAIEQARRVGLKTIILDHHLPPETLPPAEAIVDPFLPGSPYPFTSLCGCALAYKLTEALSEEFEVLDLSFRKWLLDLVAISTVGDVMPLVGENRVLVYYGLQVLRQTRRPGLRALMESAGVRPAQVSAGTIAFALAPRLNAAGRLRDNRPAFELLITDSIDQARVIAAELERDNRQRQQLMEQVLNEAEKQLWGQNSRRDRLFALHGERWPKGVVGLVAGRLSERYNRPVILGSREDERIVGSGRSPRGYPLIDGLTAASAFLQQFGGHKQAAGFTLKTDSWEAAVKILKAHASQNLSEDDLVPSVIADAKLRDDELNLAAAKSLERLQPHGYGNPKPVFIVERAAIENLRPIGNGEHRRFDVRRADLVLPGVGFRVGDRLRRAPAGRLNLLVNLEVNRWNDEEKVELRLIDYQNPKTKIHPLIDGDNTGDTT